MRRVRTASGGAPRVRLALALATAAWLPAQPVHAITRITVEAATLEIPGVAAVRAPAAVVTLREQGYAAVQASAAEARLPVAGTFGGLRLQCARLVLREPDWRCTDGTVQARRTPLGALQARLDARYHSARAAWDLRLGGLALADGRLDVHATSLGARWQLDAGEWRGSLGALSTWLQRWWQPPAGWQFAGLLSVRAQASGTGARTDAATFALQVRELTLQNTDSTIATDKVTADLTLRMTGSPADWQAQTTLRGTGGQALAGPALLDFAAHPLSLQALASARDAGDVQLRELRIDSDGLARAHGDARVALRPAPVLHELQLTLDTVRFPAAYAAFLQLPLATTDFGNLQSQGDLHGALAWRDGRARSLDLATDSLDFTDEAKGLALRGLQGDVHWRAADLPAPAASRVRWHTARAFGLQAGSSTLALLAHGDTLQLTGPARVPLFDGALQVQRFEARKLGTSAVELDFDGRIDAIGMPQLSRAFGWPEMAGTLSGRLPGLTYRAGTLGVAGDLAARVFDGTITASGLQLRDPFGRFPRLRGTFTARGLDLGAITRTFPIGSITGRLDADVQALELFGWTPVAFDAQLYTTPGDRSRHRISQKAVNSLANLGGGGGGVMAALQSGFLRFFDEFGYDRIGLRCVLRDDVCLMNGIARAEGGFYIVKGGGLPRLDVIGTSGRVAWSQLVSQVSAALSGGQLQVR